MSGILRIGKGTSDQDKRAILKQAIECLETEVCLYVVHEKEGGCGPRSFPAIVARATKRLFDRPITTIIDGYYLSIGKHDEYEDVKCVLDIAVASSATSYCPHPILDTAEIESVTDAERVFASAVAAKPLKPETRPDFFKLVSPDVTENYLSSEEG